MDKPGSVPATLLNLNPNQTAVLISPNRKGGEFFNGNEDEMVLTDGAVSNEGIGLKDGLKGPNESPDKDELNDLTSGTKGGPVDLTAPDNDGGLVAKGGTGPNEGLKGSENGSNGSDTVATLVDNTDINMNRLNDGELNAASKQAVVPSSVINMSGKGKEGGKDALALTDSVSMDGAVLGGDVVMEGVPLSL